MFRNRKAVPFSFTILSTLYIIYIVALGDSRMLGDEIGGDPGGMIIPLILGIFMLASSFYIFLTDKKTQTAEKKMDPVDRRLFLSVLIISILYAALSRFLGFLLSTSLALYILVFINLNFGLGKDCIKPFFFGMLISEAVLLAVYTVGRTITRSMTIASRNGSLSGFFASSGAILAVTAIAAAALVFIAVFIARKALPKASSSDKVNSAFSAGMISLISTQALYLIFKQLFLVNLVSGLIGW